MTKPLIIGLTGPSGAGKSTVVSALLSDSAIRCINMDALSREVTQAGSPTLARLVNAFSSDILHSDGTLNRKKLAELAFATQETTNTLNAITHPAIWVETERLLSAYSSSADVRSVILDAPLLLESGMNRLCDRIVVVTASYEERLRRICARDAITNEQAKSRLERQQADAYYTNQADFILDTTESDATILSSQLQALREQIKRWCTDA